MRQSGLKDRWFERADEGVYAVAAEANGELFEQLARAAAFIDDGAVPLLREGGCLIRGSVVACALSVGRARGIDGRNIEGEWVGQGHLAR